MRRPADWRLTLFLAWLGWTFDVMDTALFTYAKGPMLTEMLGSKEAYLQLGPAIEGRIQSLFLVGWAIGGFVFGLLADRWGRGKTLALTIGLYCLFTGLTGLCHTPEQVAMARFLTALGIGGEWAAGAALVAESVPDRFRPRAAAILQTAAAAGPILASGAAALLANESWRWIFAVGVLPAALAFVFRRNAAAHAPAPDAATTAIPKAADEPVPVSHLFAPGQRRATITAILIGIVGVTGAGIAPFWVPNLVGAALPNLSKAELAGPIFRATMTMHAGTLAGVLLFPLLMERFGRRLPLAVFFALAPIVFALALLGEPTYTRLLITLPLVTFVTIGLSAGFGLYFPELFPARLRATGAGLAYNTGRIVSAPVPSLLGGMAKAGDLSKPILLSASIYLIGLVAALAAPETKGRKLDESVAEATA